MTRDTVLSLDVGADDCLYRILRERGAADDEGDGDSNNNDSKPRSGHDGSHENPGGAAPHKRVVYVVLKHLDLIPEEQRSSGPEVIRYLSKLMEWRLEWKTLTVVSRGDGTARGEPDEFQPHALSQRQLFGNFDYLDILELPVEQSVKHRSFRVRQGTAHRFLKIARFAFELDWLAQEVQAHHILAHRDASLAPRILGFAYEETRERVIGLVFEEVTGRRPAIADLEACQAALQKLHDLDIIHGDVVGDNMFVMEDGGVKFIDFEESCIGPLGEEGDWRQRKEDEMQSLREKLMSESTRGMAHDR